MAAQESAFVFPSALKGKTKEKTSFELLGGTDTVADRRTPTKLNSFCHRSNV